MAEARWTPETEELVARRIAAVDKHRCDDVDEVWRSYREQAQAALDEILPAWGETHVEWGARIWTDGESEDERKRGDILREGRRSAEHVVAYHARQREAVKSWTGNASLIRRVVHTGPWIEVAE